MSDFASQVGGTATDTDFGAVPPAESWAYFWNGDTLNLNMGDQYDMLDARGQTGDITVYGGSGDDQITTSYTGTNFLSGQDGNDIIDASAIPQLPTGPTPPNGTFPGATVDNTIPGANSTLLGGSGNDTLIGTGGDNKIDGGTDADLVTAGSGADSVTGGSGNDTLLGDNGGDQLFGGSGDDAISGGADDDFLVGGSGSDFLVGGAGNDWLYGGSDSDTFFFDDNFGSDVIADFDISADQILLTSDINGLGITTSNDVLPFLSGGTDPDTQLPFTLITLGADVIRVNGIDQTDFANNISTYVKIAP